MSEKYVFCRMEQAASLSYTLLVFEDWQWQTWKRRTGAWDARLERVLIKGRKYLFL
jgi:hypothetical protein